MEYERTQDRCSQKKTDPWIGKLLEPGLKPVHGLREIERNQAAGNTQKQGVGYSVQVKSVLRHKMEHGISSRKDI